MPLLPLAVARKSFQKELGLSSSPTPSRNSGGTQNALEDERRKVSFGVETMTNIFDGSKENTARRRWIQSATKDYQPFVIRDVNREEVIEEHVQNFMEIHSSFVSNPQFKLQDNDMNSMFQSRALNGFIGVHYNLFVATLKSQASEEQLGWWLEKAMRLQMIGCYAQTELGKGSNVRGLQTTATFDPSTDEFIVDTPTLASMKFWPTGLLSSTHCVLYAQLITQNKNHGVHVFFMQLRGEDFKPLPGVEMGDVGTKVGDNQADIGYLRLQQVRIPRSHLLAKRQIVNATGEYEKLVEPGKSTGKLAYLTMLQTRSGMVSRSAVVLSEACTIAVRYSLVRSQGFRQPSASATNFQSEEYKLLDYATQRHRLLRRLAQAMTMKVVGQRMSEMTLEMTRSTDLTDISELHATSSILKAYCTTLASAGIEECRKCCGGAGYLLASGLGDLETWWKGPFETAEGDPTVLTLQTARFLMKAYQSARKGEPLGTLAAIFSQLKDPSFDPVVTGRPQRLDCTHLESLIAFFEYRALRVVTETGRQFEKSLAQLNNYDLAWNENLRSLVNCATIHGIYFMLKCTSEWLNNVLDSACSKVLQQLFCYFALNDMNEGFMWTGILSYDDSKQVEASLDAVSKNLRYDMLGVCDAFDISDVTLNSALGRYDGNVYEHVYESAVKSPLNMNADGTRILVPEYFKALARFLDKDFLAKRTTRVLPFAKL